MNTLGKTSPWVTWIAKLKEFFKEDPDITIEYDSEFDPENVDICVSDPYKFYALTILMEPEMVFGNVHLMVNVYPAGLKQLNRVELFKKIFENSPIVTSIDEIKPEGTSNTFTYISFKNEVVKYWSDNLGNPHGNEFTLYETLADELFQDHDGVFFTTAE